MPVCPACGFGADAPGAVAAGGEPATPKNSVSLGGAAITAIIIGIFVVVGGAIAAGIYFGGDGTTPGAGTPGPGNGGNGGTNGGSMLSQAEADARAAQAIEDLGGIFEDGEPGDLRLLTMDFTGTDPEFGDMDFAVSMEWGLADRRHIAFDMVFGGDGMGFSFAFEAFCAPDEALIKWGSQVYRARTADPEECDTDFDDDSGLAPGAVDPTSTDQLEFTQATPNPDGTVSVTYIDEDGNRYDATIDGQGRLISMGVDEDDVTGSITFDYGPKQAIEFPEPTTELPADVTIYPDFTDHPSDPDGSQRYILTTPQTGLQRNEFEIRIYHYEENGYRPPDFQNDTPITTINLAQAAISEADFSYSWMSDDLDGVIDDGEVFRLTKPGENIEARYWVVLWDLEVDQEAGTNPIPGPFWLAPLALLGLAARRL